MVRSALISGIAGQDGYYLTEFLLSKGYVVYGFDNHAIRLSRFRAEFDGRPAGRQVVTRVGDIRNQSFLEDLIDTVRPYEIYNLAAQSHVGRSFVEPRLTVEVALAIGSLLEIVARRCPDARVFQASTAEMYGDQPPPQNERTSFRPLSPYASAKLRAHELLLEARAQRGLHASTGILFNHESPRRRVEFVTRKVTHAVAEIVSGDRVSLSLGNLHCMRDWGHANEYVEIMWRILQYSQPVDLVVATGESRSVEQLVATVFAMVERDWRQYVTVDATLRRPADPPNLCGDATLARELLGWQPKVGFDELIEGMLDADLRACRQLVGPVGH